MRLFLVGCERSGTTLLQAMLDRHPLLAMPPESYFVLTLGDRLARYTRGGTFDGALFTADLLADADFGRWQLPAQDVRRALRDAPDFAAAVRTVYVLHAAREGKSAYGDKTPAYVMALPRLTRWFPEAQVVHLIRDGRNVATALVDRAHKRPAGVGEAALWWRRRVRAGQRAGALLGPARYREVRYEALVADPTAVLTELLDWLGLGFDPAILDPRPRAAAFARRFDHPEQHRHLAEPVRPGLRDWQRDLSPADLAVFEVLAGDLIDRLGYSRSTAQVDLRARSRASVVRVESLARQRAGSARRVIRRAGARLPRPLGRAAPAGSDRPQSGAS